MSSVHAVSPGLGGGVGVGSLGLTPANPGSGRVRAAVESVLTYHLMDHYEEQLREAGLWRAFTETEMPVITLLATMEMNGFGKTLKALFKLMMTVL